jgi:3-oxoacyl-[acyl-carrier-protein] synthase-3
MGSKLVGCGSAIPTLSVSNDDLSKIVETSDEWIAARTGIRNRRVLSGNYVFFIPSSTDRLAHQFLFLVVY